MKHHAREPNFSRLRETACINKKIPPPPTANDATMLHATMLFHIWDAEMYQAAGTSDRVTAKREFRVGNTAEVSCRGGVFSGPDEMKYPRRSQQNLDVPLINSFIRRAAGFHSFGGQGWSSSSSASCSSTMTPAIKREKRFHLSEAFQL